MKVVINSLFLFIKHYVKFCIFLNFFLASQKKNLFQSKKIRTCYETIIYTFIKACTLNCSVASAKTRKFLENHLVCMFCERSRHESTETKSHACGFIEAECLKGWWKGNGWPNRNKRE